MGIETSCDDTSCAVVEDGSRVLSNVVSSQTEIHRKFGGVVPEEASRRHLELMLPVIDEALVRAEVDARDISAVGVTFGPGLVGSLLVGLSTAKAFAFGLGIPLIGINHIEGHIYANFLQYPDLMPPLVALVVSGGHSEIFYLPEHGRYEIMGRTRDDAAGEAFDKVARILGLGYPGGAVIDRLAKEGNPGAIEFPRAYLEEGSLDFSFSGLKTAVLNYVKRNRDRGFKVQDVAASFQEAVIDVLVDKLLRAARLKGVTKVALAGGVAANTRLRERLWEAARGEGFEVFIPDPDLCTDNAAMIAAAAYRRYLGGERSPLCLDAVPNLELGSPIS